ncbi:MAG: HAD domain-containing protein [Rhodoferax sp.]
MTTPNQLNRRYPYMFSGENVGISIPRGWTAIFEALCIDIDQTLGTDKRGFHFTQCKERFGSARWYSYTVEQLREIFSAEIAGQLVGVINQNTNASKHWLPGFIPEYQAQWEFESWLSENCAASVPWVAIDDRADRFAPDCPNLLLISYRRGFSPEDQDALRQMLRQSL